MELIDRYVHQVGRYVPRKERAEIEAELRSLIQDQLEDRFAESPSQEDVATVLTELGNPYQMATSYGGEQYLIGPELYPYMMMVLRLCWIIMPSIVIFLSAFDAATSSEEISTLKLLGDTLMGVVEATFNFSAFVVLTFALFQYFGLKVDSIEEAFNPLELPKVDDPGNVDRFEAIFGIAFGGLVTLVFLYFLRVGGLTLHFTLGDPKEITPIPTEWMWPLIVASIGMIVLHMVVLRRNRWNVSLWFIETVLELFGMICVYFVISEPLFDSLLTAKPSLADIPFIEKGPEIIAVSSAVITVLGRGTRLLALWNHENSQPLPFKTQVQ